jgi:hypothetical protein
MPLTAVVSDPVIKQYQKPENPNVAPESWDR